MTPKQKRESSIRETAHWLGKKRTALEALGIAFECARKGRDARTVELRLKDMLARIVSEKPKEVEE